MQRNNTEPLKQVIQRYLNAIGAKQKIKEIQLKNSWNKIMGNNIAEQTDYVYVKNGTFYVKLRSSVIKYELSMMKTKIIEHLNESVGEVLIKDINFL